MTPFRGLGVRCRSADEQYWCSTVAASTLVHRQPYPVDRVKCCTLDGSSQKVGYRDFVIRTDVQGRCRALGARLLRSTRQQQVSRSAGAVWCAPREQACGGRARPHLATTCGGLNAQPHTVGLRKTSSLQPPLGGAGARHAHRCVERPGHGLPWRDALRRACGWRSVFHRPWVQRRTPSRNRAGRGLFSGESAHPVGTEERAVVGGMCGGRDLWARGCSPACSRVAVVSRAGPGPRGRPGSVRARRGRL